MHNVTISILALAIVVGVGLALQPPNPIPTLGQNQPNVGGGGTRSILVVDLGWKGPSPNLTTEIAVLACSGLFNRVAAKADSSIIPAVYTLRANSSDDIWFNLTQHAPAVPNIGIEAFLSKCATTPAAVKGYIRYNITSQQAAIPAVITLAGVLDALPLPPNSPIAAGGALPLLFDATSEFRGMEGWGSSYHLTRYLYKHFVNRTTGLAMMNPGFDEASDPLDPSLSQRPNVGLTDFIVAQRLFNFYLPQGCIPLTLSHSLMDALARHFEAAQGEQTDVVHPVAVYGYDDTWPVAGGDLFEAETDCTRDHGLGQVASKGVNNLPFFGLAPPITRPMHQSPTASLTFNASKTYLALVVGDGDNIAYVKHERYQWFQQRLEHCGVGVWETKSGETWRLNPKKCFPLLWTLSPHLLHLAPAWAEEYYRMAAATGGRDHFVLPPSGALYSYPAMMPPPIQEAYVAETERVATLMNTSCTMEWEWFFDWEDAIEQYAPRYSEEGIIRSLVGVDVPFNVPVVEMWDRFFLVLGSRRNVVLFRPREWRGTTRTSIPFAKRNSLTPAEMAAEVNGYPPGTVTAIYLTSDGGANMTALFDLVPQLQEHVEIVDHENLARMALASG